MLSRLVLPAQVDGFAQFLAIPENGCLDHQLLLCPLKASWKKQAFIRLLANSHVKQVVSSRSSAPSPPKNEKTLPSKNFFLFLFSRRKHPTQLRICQAAAEYLASLQPGDLQTIVGPVHFAPRHATAK